MITVIIKRNLNNEVCEVDVSGHANQAKYGSDIVCSAVSALTISTLNGIIYVAKVDVDYTVKEGHVNFKIKNLNESSQAILRTYELGIEALLENYEKYLQLVKEGGATQC